MAYGATDEFGWDAVENPVHVHDLARHDPAPAGARSREADVPQIKKKKKKKKKKNRKLKQLVADLSLDKQMLQDVLSKNV